MARQHGCEERVCLCVRCCYLVCWRAQMFRHSWVHSSLDLLPALVAHTILRSQAPTSGGSSPEVCEGGNNKRSSLKKRPQEQRLFKRRTNKRLNSQKSNSWKHSLFRYLFYVYFGRMIQHGRASFNKFLWMRKSLHWKNLLHFICFSPHLAPELRMMHKGENMWNILNFLWITGSVTPVWSVGFSPSPPSLAEDAHLSHIHLALTFLPAAFVPQSNVL